MIIDGVKVSAVGLENFTATEAKKYIDYVRDRVHEPLKKIGQVLEKMSIQFEPDTKRNKICISNICSRMFYSENVARYFNGYENLRN